MIYRRLDTNGDYSFGKSLQDFLFGADAVAQAIKTRLQLLRGEWWEDTSEGFPLFQSVLGAPGTQANLQAIDLLVRRRIIETPGVSQITEFLSSYYNRQYSIHCTVVTTSGQTATIEVAY